MFSFRFLRNLWKQLWLHVCVSLSALWGWFFSWHLTSQWSQLQRNSAEWQSGISFWQRWTHLWYKPCGKIHLCIIYSSKPSKLVVKLSLMNQSVTSKQRTLKYLTIQSEKGSGISVFYSSADVSQESDNTFPLQPNAKKDTKTITTLGLYTFLSCMIFNVAFIKTNLKHFCIIVYLYGTPILPYKGKRP